MKPFGDAFIKMIKSIIAPLVFCTVVVGIAKLGDMGRHAPEEILDGSISANGNGQNEKA